MARVWQPLENPAYPATRSRSTMTTVAPQTQWGQRPMFSEPGPDQPPPESGSLMPETQIDSVTPIDGRQGSEGVAEVRKDDVFAPVDFPVSIYNVTSPPTDAEIKLAVGNSLNLGDSVVIQDGTGAGKLWLIIRGGADLYWYAQLTKAV